MEERKLNLKFPPQGDSTVKRNVVLVWSWNRSPERCQDPVVWRASNFFTPLDEAILKQHIHWHFLIFNGDKDVKDDGFEFFLLLKFESILINLNINETSP